MDHPSVKVDVDPNSNQRRIAQRGSVVLGAAISLGLMFWVGRHNGSAVLVLLFTLWVASPFVALFLVDRAASRHPASTRRAAGGLLPLVGLGSALIYVIEVFLVHPVRAAAPFLAVPAVSWVIILLSLWISRRSRGEAAIR